MGRLERLLVTLAHVTLVTKRMGYHLIALARLVLTHVLHVPQRLLQHVPHAQSIHLEHMEVHLAHVMLHTMMMVHMLFV